MYHYSWLLAIARQFMVSSYELWYHYRLFLVTTLRCMANKNNLWRVITITDDLCTLRCHTWCHYWRPIDDQGWFSYKYEAIMADVTSLLLDVQWFTSPGKSPEEVLSSRMALNKLALQLELDNMKLANGIGLAYLVQHRRRNRRRRRRRC